MPFSSGTYTLLYDFEADRDAGRPSSLIKAERMQAQLQDIADALTQCAPVIGGEPWLVDADMGTHFVTNMGTSNQNDAAATVKQAAGQVSWVGTFGGTANALTCTNTAAPAPFDGMEIAGLIAADNTTTTPTIGLNGTGAVQIVDSRGNLIAAGTLLAGALVTFRRVTVASVTRWRLVSSVGGGSGTVSTDATMSGNGLGSLLSTITPPEVVTYSGSITLDFTPATKSPIKQITLTGNPSISATGLTAGETIVIRVHQDATGGRQITWDTQFVWAGGQPPTLNSAANGVTILCGLVRSGTQIDMAMSTGGGGGFTVQTFTANGTWNKPVGCKRIRVRLVGAGGGGAAAVSAASQSCAGGGGGGGAYSEGVFDVTGVSSYAVTIGQGGAGSTDTSAGASGTSSSFGALLTAPGGAGGAHMASGTTGAVGQGGSGANAGAGGYLNAQGASGGHSFRLAFGVHASGHGSEGPFGGRRPPIYGTNSGSSGASPGVGGSGGAASGAVTSNGGNGANGICIVEEYY